MKKWLHRITFPLAALVVAGLSLVAASVSADTIVQSFASQSPIKTGWVVAIKPGSTNMVELAPANQPQQLYGVSIDPSKAPLTLQRQTGQQVFVATSGTYPVLVSTQNGPISVGDYLSISGTNGTAAKASNSQVLVLGQALQKFNGTSNVLNSGSNGSAVGMIQVTVSIQRNPFLQNTVAIPSFLKGAGDAIAGKEVSPLRIYAALAVFLVAAVIACGALIVGIRSAMIAIGRNPLSRHFILNGLVQVVIVAVAVLSLGVIGVYLLLKL